MSNVNKPTKTKLINIDTIFRDEYNHNDTSHFNTTLPEKYKYNITIPERLTNVKTMRVVSAEIPMTFYNISANLGNNSFVLTIYSPDYSTKQTVNIVVPDGYYNSTASLIAAINISVSGYSIIINQNPDNTINFTLQSVGASNISGQNMYNNYIVTFSSQDIYSFKKSLGWILGFRSQSYTIKSYETVDNISSYVILNSEQPVISTIPAYPKYLYLSVDEFSKSVQNSFLTPVYNAFLTKNVIARVSLNNSTFPFGSVLPVNIHNGTLVTDKRNYNGKVDLQKLSIQLLNEMGMPIDLNTQDFSFCIEVTYE